MRKLPGRTTLDQLPETFVSRTEISQAVSRAVRAGKLRKLGSRLYTTNLVDPPEEIVRRNVWGIVAGYFPGAVVADRTAFEIGPGPDGSICLVADRGRTVELPGAVLRPRRGPGPTASDQPFMDGLHLSSRARAYLENMRRSRTGAHIPRTLSRAQIEERLDGLIRLSGETGANRLRDAIRTVAPEIGLQAEADELDRMIGALLGTREARLEARAALARRRGHPFDPHRLELFQTLHRELRASPARVRPPSALGAPARRTLAFYEAYFSNFIEGTEFEVEEAAALVFEDVVPPKRPADAHDILGTWRIVSDPAEMRRTPADFKTLLELLRERHRGIMGGRPETNPGRFKTQENRAGGTVFVAPELVVGTLEQGFGLYRSLEWPFEQAAFMMFLVSEVHPFADGNGRLARIMMNAELSASDQPRIVVPTVFRLNYLAGLRALSRTGRAQSLIQVLEYAQRWTAAVRWRSVLETKRELEACNAFLDANEAEEMGMRLRMPGPRPSAPGY